MQMQQRVTPTIIMITTAANSDIPMMIINDVLEFDPSKTLDKNDDYFDCITFHTLLSITRSGYDIRTCYTLMILTSSRS